MLKQKRSRNDKDNSNSYMIGEFGNGKTPKVLSGSPKIATTVKEGQNQNLLLRNVYKWYIYTVNNASNLRNIV